MNLHHDLDRLKEGLEQKRRQLETHMSESTLSSAKTDDLAVRLRSLSKRMEATADAVAPRSSAAKS